MITQPGTVEFWIDPKKNPTAFIERTRIKWIEFRLGPETCEVISDGPNLACIMNSGTGREFSIFSVIPPYTSDQRHMVDVTWSSEEMVLYWDGLPIHTCRFEDF
jgi:hypothetical protein